MSRVLLVDDSEPVRMTLGALLEDEGFTVVEAESLAEARLRLPQGPYALVVLDMQLGDGQGPDLLPEVRRDAAEAVVAILSGQSADEISADADLILTKDGGPEEIIAALVAAARM